MRTLVYYISLCFFVLVSACNTAKHLPQGDSLFIGSKVKIKDNEVTTKQAKVLRKDLTGSVRPRPNSQFLGLRFKLWLYTLSGTKQDIKPNGLRNWLRNKVGEAPVLTSTFDLEKNKQIFNNMLQNRGFYYPVVTGHTETKRRRTTAIFEVTTGPQYLIRETIFPVDSSLISTDISNLKDKTLLKPGQPYNLDLIKAERERIDRGLKEIGYYFFTPDYILIKADTNEGDHKVNLYVTVKDSIPYQAFNIYDIGKVYIYPNFRLRGKVEDTSKENATLYKGYYVVDPRKTYKPFVFTQAMQFEPGEEYNRRDQNTSLNRLVSLNTFKFVKSRFEPINDSTLDVYYYLTPFPKKSLQFQLGGLTQNDSRYGTNASISWRNRNTFRGAEEFKIKINGGFEAQYGGTTKRPNIYHGGAEAALSVPRFLIPFVHIKGSSYYIPRTYIKAGYNYESQSDLLRINSYKFSYGYNWKEDVRKDHQLYPINFTYVRTDTLGRENLNLFYGNLIFNGIILGPTYEYTYNSQAGSTRKNNLYLNGLIDLSGNIIGLAQKADYSDNPQKIFGSHYAQYLKLQGDARNYFNFFPGFVFANRVFLGYGYPYGNSYQLPNVKQFFSGGNSSLRGFRSRLVGPGTFNEQYLYGSNNYIQTLGDIKVEANSELRIKVYQFIHTAIFADAGNIWLLRDNPNFPGGKFSSESYKEMAADIGVGLRLDFKILLLRLDLGMPVRKPWLPEGERWVFNQINFGDGSWRGQNLLFNLAIGYPF